VSQPLRPPSDAAPPPNIDDTQAFETVERSGRAGDTTEFQTITPQPSSSLITRHSSLGQGIAFAALMLMVGNVLSRLLGLVREQVAAGMFGTTDDIAAFTIADNIHTMLFDLVISGMMQAALIPVLSMYALAHQRDELRRITGALLVLSAILVGGIVLLLEIFAPAAVRVMTALGGGEQVRGADTVALTVELVRWILPAVLLLAFSTILMSTLYALQRFTRASLSLSLRNVAIIATTGALGWTAFGIRSMALGIVLGALLLIVVQLPGLRDAMPRLNMGFGHPAIRRIGVLYLPIFIGLLANTVALVVDRNLAWEAGEHALGAMRYATTLNQMVLGLVAAAISLASLPAMSRYAAAGDDEAFWATLLRGLRMITVLVIPATLGLAVLSWPAVQLLFEHGATSREGATQILIALLIYLPGTLFAAYDQVLIFAYFARQNTLTPQVVGVLAVIIYFAFALPLAGPFGMAGLVAANSAQFIFHTIVMIVLVRRLRPETVRAGDDGRLLRTIQVCTLVALFMAAIAGGLAYLLAIGLPDVAGGLGHIVREAVLVLIPTAAGAAIYAAGLLYFRIEEMQTIQQRVFALIGR
jgi:putative peptidoglycan lipid II flippase